METIRHGSLGILSLCWNGMQSGCDLGHTRMATKTRIAPAEGYAAYADDHLAYEAQMFVLAWDLYDELEEKFRSTTPNRAEVLHANMIAEACLLHFRNLVDFLFPSSFNETDVVASNYDPGWEKKVTPPELNELRNRVHKELAHLTTERKSKLSPGPQKDWRFGDLRDRLAEVVEDFTAVPTLLPKKAVDELMRIRRPKVRAKLLVGGGPVFNSSGPSLPPPGFSGPL
jgi:hypothetical protein